MFKTDLNYKSIFYLLKSVKKLVILIGWFYLKNNTSEYINSSA